MTFFSSLKLALLGLVGTSLAACVTTSEPQVTRLPDGSAHVTVATAQEGLTFSQGVAVAYQCRTARGALIFVRNPNEAKSLMRVAAKGGTYSCAAVASAGGSSGGAAPIIGAALMAGGMVGAGAVAPPMNIVNQASAAASANARNNIRFNPRIIQNNNQQVF